MYFLLAFASSGLISPASTHSLIRRERLKNFHSPTQNAHEADWFVNASLLA